jgi:large repetitive protein
VTTPSGTTAAGPSDLFTYGPAVTNISPNTGPPAGGTSVTVTGTGFTATSSVSFGGSAGIITSFNGSTTLIVTAPAGTGAVDVSVTNPALVPSSETSPTSSADQYTYAMSVTSLSPVSGLSTGGTTVDIKGQGFTGVTGVTFGGVPATNVTFLSDGEITAVSPAGAGTVDVQVTTPAGTSARGTSDQFSYTGASSALAGLGIQLNGATPSPTLGCTYHGNGNNTCSISGVGCGGSATFYVETVDGNGNPVVVTAPGGQAVVVGAGATPSGVTVPQGSFTTYAAPSGSQSVTAQLSPPTCAKNQSESEKVTLSTTINGKSTSLTVTVSSS